MKLTIDVTQEDIDEGCKVDSTGIKGGCMVWRAFNRCTEGAFPWFRVEHEEILIYDDIDRMLRDSYGSFPNQIIELPWGVDKLIMNFDEGEPVEPFSFDIDIPVGTNTSQED